jgi:4-methylaminobutanoate oxidase (formaldehyde-forming)
VFGAPTGWERPLYFAADDSETGLPYSYGEQAWWPLARREALHCQRRVSLFELSPFGKFDIGGDDALSFLQAICCSDIDVEPGRAIYSLMLNRRGGIEAEVSVTRLAPNRFRVVGGAATRFKDLYWLRRQLQPGSDVAIHDVTEDYAVVGVMGPDSRSLLQELSGTDFAAASFPFSTAQSIRIGECELLALRLSFVGELGWELHIQCADALSVLDRLITVGKNYELGFAGHYALDSCRLEMGYRHWGHDIGPGDTPFEAGLGFAVCFDKPLDFLGKAALLESRHGTQKRRLRLCEVGANPVLILHDEPVYSGGKIVGHCTSGGQGFRSGKTLCFVMYYHDDYCTDLDGDLGDDCEIEVAGERFPLAILDQPPYRANTG